MDTILNISLFVLLGIAFLQDKQSRSIHVGVFIALGVVTAVLFHLRAPQASEGVEWNIVLMNIAFVVMVILGLILYISIKENRLVNIFKAHFGIGDLVFFIAVTPLFSNRNFILFFITGIVFSGALHWMVQRQRSGETIPLAGYLSIYLIALKIIDLSAHEALFYTDII